ncbi:MAG: hypothetical protein WCF57_12550 [Pyrinomonadaceae bacterium]
MKRTKHLACAIALTFLAGLLGSVQAQNRLTTLKGIEVAAGTEDGERGIINGASVLGKTTGVWPGSFFLSLNYEQTSFSSFPSVPTENAIKSGTWSLPIYRADKYLGAMFGRVIEGTMQWNSDKTIAKVTITLSVDGGTQTYAKANGKGYFVGTLDRTTRGRPTMNGTLEFVF